MKIASRVLGGLTLAMLVAVIALTFVGAVNIKNGVSVESGGSQDVGSIVAGGLETILMLLGYVGFVLMVAVGCVLILYLICFCVSYGKLYKAKSNPEFIKYSAYTWGVIMFFEVILFAVKPSAGWRPFVVLLLMTGLSIAYAVVATLYLKNSTEYDIIKKDDRYDEPPKFTYDIGDK